MIRKAYARSCVFCPRTYVPLKSTGRLWSSAMETMSSGAVEWGPGLNKPTGPRKRHTATSLPAECDVTLLVGIIWNKRYWRVRWRKVVRPIWCPLQRRRLSRVCRGVLLPFLCRPARRQLAPRRHPPRKERGSSTGTMDTIIASSF